MTMALLRRTTTALALALTTALVAPTAASATGSGSIGTTSLASVLTGDGNQFDRDWYDYDIVTEAVLAVIAADTNGDSPVRLLTDGSTPLTAFIPNDRAFQVLVKDLTGTWVRTEQDVFAAVAGLGLDTVEDVLLYHVVPGATITARDALRSNGAELTTALGPTIGVKVARWLPIIVLRDQDPDDIDPLVNPLALDINRGNAQIAHGITFVLRPCNL
jgi:hypothetical protein